MNGTEENNDDDAEASDKKSSLVDLVFSWSIQDVLNKDLYSLKVEPISTTFASTSSYKESFIFPLIEETHADLHSSMLGVSDAPTFEISSMEFSKSFDPPKDLIYDIEVERKKDIKVNEEQDEPEPGDLIALTDRRPNCIDDLNRSKNLYLIALVQRAKKGNDYLYLQILTSKPLVLEQDGRSIDTKETRFVVTFINMTTYTRIWKALNSELGSTNDDIIKNVLKLDSSAGDGCKLCSLERKQGLARSSSRVFLHSLGLNDSQEEAALNFITTKDCYHENTVKLIWGPPGTGKTKTTGVLLFALLWMKCRTLTCAPTNIAVLEVAERLVNLAMDSAEYGTYGLGDILLFGNDERMKIKGRENLKIVFLDNRAKILSNCFASLTGWKHCLRMMISLLEDPLNQFHLYISIEQDKDEEWDSDKEKEGSYTNGTLKCNDYRELRRRPLNEKHKRNWKNHIAQILKQCNINEKRNELPLHSHSKNGKPYFSKKKKLKFGDFVRKKFKFFQTEIEFLVANICTHLPTHFLLTETVETMIRTLSLLEYIRSFLCSARVTHEQLTEIFSKRGDSGSCFSGSSELLLSIEECLKLLRSLPEDFFPPNIYGNSMKQFCLDKSCLLFSTASSSMNLHKQGVVPVELLIVDEAAQLKECESTIPLQLPGLRHVVLIGDEQQLPALVKSQICAKADFGRSLFERLVLLGQKRHLLNTQYRMHPSISFFPNREFYKRQIMDAPNVKEKSYHKRFLQGDLYGPYSFINIAYGSEEVSDKSMKNITEVAAVSEIVARLFNESNALKQKVSIGIISPYKAQVSAIQETLGTTYSTSAASDFRVRVRSVDGFQGGEEDVIIISTVRSNGNGAVGFLTNRQRVNVALTRARHCLWILGNGSTLKNSGSVWKKLVGDAKARGCFYNADEDRSLALAIAAALVDVDLLDIQLYSDSLLFSGARWKVCFDGNFWKSLQKIRDLEIRKESISLLTKLSSGWRGPRFENNIMSMNGPLAQLLECYCINGMLYVALTVDILMESSNHVQVLKVWDLLALPDIPKLAKNLNDLFERYTVDDMNLRRCRGMEGTLVVPMTWPVIHKPDHMKLLSDQFAALCLK